MYMSVVPDVINIRTQPGEQTTFEFWARVDAAKRVHRMIAYYMSEKEAAYWDDQSVHDLLWSMPTEDVDMLNRLPNEDIRWYFDSCVGDLVHVKKAINALAA